MYDLKKDPYQLKNLINEPAYAEKKQELKQQLDAVRKELGEAMTLGGKVSTGTRRASRKSRSSKTRRAAAP